MGRSNFYSTAVLSTIQRNQEGTAELTSGFLQSLMWTIFFALCPVFFKMVANFGSKANSVANAELRALQYFWWFMVVSAFSSTLIANMVLFGFNEGSLGGELRSILRSIARAIPSTTAAMWLNWLIFRTTVTMPALYLLQVNSFLFDFFGFRCCSRLSRGGGECGTFHGSLMFEHLDISHPNYYLRCRLSTLRSRSSAPVSLVCGFGCRAHVLVGIGHGFPIGGTGCLLLLYAMPTIVAALLYLCLSTQI